MEFAYDGGGLGKGGAVTLYVDGEPGRRGPRRGHGPMLFSADETLRHRRGHGHAGERRPHVGGSVFTGTVDWVQIDLDEASEDLDHLITPEERLRIAMARQ